MMKNIFRNLLNLIFPPKCPYCGEIIEDVEACCQNCEKSLETFQLIKIINIENSQRIRCISPFYYDGNVKAAITRYKFRGQKAYAAQFAVKIMDCMKIDPIFKNIHIDVVTSVPLSPKRQASRGYNQAELLAKEVAHRLSLPYQRLLHKCKNNQEQHKLSAKEREDNVRGVYKPVNPEKIAGKTILLCDDIVTTGNTLKECAKILLGENAKAIYCATIASATKRKD